MANYVEAFFIVAIFSFLFYKWATAKYKTFAERNIKHDKPLVLVGNTLSLFTGSEAIHKLLIRQHEKFKTEKIYGYYNIRDPIFIIRDPELIKKIGVKDFDSFANHRSSETVKEHELLENMLTVLQDQKWKDMRATLTPVFTGSKMRQIFELVNECGSEAVKSLQQEVKSDGLDLDFKEFFSRYTVDVIASTAFGLKVNSFRDKENDFYVLGRKILKFEGLAIVKFLIATVAPQLQKILKLQIFNVAALNYLRALIVNAIQDREKNKIIRNDVIHLLLEAQKHGQAASEENGQKTARNWTDEEIYSQLILFFFAGFDTVSNMLCFTAHELMKNPEVQEKLYEEIAEMNNELNGAPLTYDALKKMKYLDMVASESLRMWPPAIVTDRLCSKPYTLTDSDGNFVANLKPGDNIWFSIIGSHYDESIFPQPYVFDPERFSEENKTNIPPFAYIPFGVGPRSCIANRFGLMEAKAILYKLVLEFKIVSCAKTKIDLMDAIRGFQITPKDLFWLKFIPRKGEEKTS